MQKNLKTLFFLNAEIPNVKNLFETKNPEKIYSYFGKSKYIFIDEAQTINEIGLVLKILYDTFSDIHIMVTGSSSFELSSKIHEPLTGRNRTFFLPPLSLEEWQDEKKYSRFEMDDLLEQFLRFGMYPEILSASSDAEKKEAIIQISSDYLYKDILQFQNLKNPKLLRKLLQALALQIGSEVSFHELSQLLKTSSATIEHYIDLLEKSFVIFSLPAYSTNPQKEIAKKQKIYFYDVGVRNDIGGLWENFCIVEQRKSSQRIGKQWQEFFWRSYSQKEVDYIVIENEEMNAFEYKWNTRKKVKAPKLFSDLYPHSTFSVLSPENFWKYV